MSPSLDAERSAKYPAAVTFPMQTSPSSDAIVASAAVNSNCPADISETDFNRMMPGWKFNRINISL